MRDLLFNLRDRRQLNTGFGNAMSKAFELVATPLIFALLGHLVDGWLGTAPWCMVGFTVFAFVGMMARAWIGYDTDMRRHENEMAWNRPREPKP